MTPNRAGDTDTVDLPAALLQLIHAERGHMSTRQRVDGAQVCTAPIARARLGAGFGIRGKLAVALVAGVALVAFAKLAVDHGRDRALSYAIDGGHVDGAGHIEADIARAPKLSFSDGSEVLLTMGAKAALRSIDRHGARVSVAEGGAHVDIVHQPGTHWFVDAGPFVIAVTGTAFTVGWNNTNEQLDVSMERGTVEVNGPLSDGAIVLRSGQHLIVHVRQRETLIRDGADDAPTVQPSAPMPSQSALDTRESGSLEAEPLIDPTGSARAMQTRASRSGRGPTWASELATGNFEDIVRQAEHRGIDECLANVTSSELATLADAARYGRHDEIARRALLAQRRRFPVSPAAREASFLLGRLEETDRNASRAIEWYERYLAEAPDGTYASEAFGRKMNLYEQLYGDERARPLATDYLSRFPDGPYAARARTLTHGQ